MRKVKRLLSVAVMVTLLVSTSGFVSNAAETDRLVSDVEKNVEVLEATVVEDIDLSSEMSPYTMLTECIISVTGDSQGMHIGISTGAVGKASVLGVKDVKIWKKTWYGGWDLVATSSGGESENRSIMGISILYANAVKGATYKITCVHYGNVDGYIEGENDSGAFVFNFE
ncbi:hypothetical protein AMURIS_00151 [Acetatifactor muris]|uniref:Uncharacterized protein n=2 Tax=Acetatifactor muris TaxID=879566 RepID=A0A2K4ZAF9_9FIRM|nr:hypothetical protein AMURIS_00151 [Acetatifactor muris]